ncbi:MAG: hypothetical protein ACU836_16420 [Gammaproteobacteria bacterium]
MFTNYDKSSILLPFDGANAATTAEDWSINPKIATFNGDAQISTAQSLYYGSSLLLDGNGDYVSIPSSADLNLGGGNFDICIAFYLTAYANVMSGNYWVTLLGKDGPGAREFSLAVVGTASSFSSLEFSGYSDNSTYQYVSIPYSFVLNTWYEAKITRIGNLLFGHINDVLQNPGGTAFSPIIQATSAPLGIGASIYNPTYPGYTYGHIQDVGMFKDSAQWNSSPVTARLIGEISNSGTTSVLDSSGSPMQSPVIVKPVLSDNSANRLFSTICDASGNFSLRAPACESDVIIESVETPTIYENKIVSKTLPV